MTGNLEINLSLFAGTVVAQTAGGHQPDWDRIEHTLPIRSGDSGGPIISKDGSLVGITSGASNRALKAGPIPLFTGESRKFATRPASAEDIRKIIAADYARRNAP